MILTFFLLVLTWKNSILLVKYWIDEELVEKEEDLSVAMEILTSV